MTTVQILMYDGLDELDAVAPLEILAAAGFAVTTIASGAGEQGDAIVTGTHGLRMGVDGPLAGGPTPDILVVPGGGWVVGPEGGARRAAADPAVLAAITAAHEAGAVVASVCTGAMVVAAAGLLGGRPSVTHAAAIDALRAAGADVRADERVVDDGDVVSAGGVTAGIDLALHLVERFAGAEAAERGAVRIEHERQPVLTTAGRA